MVLRDGLVLEGPRANADTRGLTRGNGGLHLGTSRMIRRDIVMIRGSKITRQFQKNSQFSVLLWPGRAPVASRNRVSPRVSALAREPL